MKKAEWNGIIIAESDETVVVEGNYYFPRESLKSDYFKPSETKTVCSWKGVASYFDVVVNGSVNKDAAWFYSETKTEANHIKNYVAFWKGVKVS